MLCDFFFIFDYAGDGDESLCNVNQIDLCVVNWILCFLVWCQCDLCVVMNLDFEIAILVTFWIQRSWLLDAELAS